MHSPFVFDFITRVLNDKTDYDEYEKVEGIRTALLTNDRKIPILDLGAGSTLLKGAERKVSQIAKRSLKSPKYAKLLFRIAKYYFGKGGPEMLELGTSLGITSSYLALANPSGILTTIEGSPEIAEIAHENFSALGITNIRPVVGNFDTKLPEVLRLSNALDFVFVDGNHREWPTLDYFSQLLEKKNAGSIFIFDDIHWSSGMENAWHQIKSHPAVTLSIDLFFIGLIFFNPDFKVKQDFSLRF